jgi:glycosyltransferase involved in cell wall biosynthesis
MARGEYLAFLDADDLWMPGKLSSQMAAFEADPALEIVGGYVEQFVEPGLTGKFSIPAGPVPGYSTIALLIKQSAMPSIGLFHEDFQKAETVSWFAGVIDKNLKILWLPEVVARRRIHGKNTSLLNHQEKNNAIIHILKNSINRKHAERHKKDHS